MTTLAAPFRSILTGLMAVIGRVAVRDPARMPLYFRIHTYLNRTIQRFEALVNHWRNNTLPKQRHRVSAPRRRPAMPRLPAGQAWLLRRVDHYDARGRASQLHAFLASPDCMALLAQVPRAARLLRPLAKSLGLALPGDPPPPEPKPAKSAKPPLPPRHRPPHDIAPAPSKPRPAFPAIFSKAR